MVQPSLVSPDFDEYDDQARLQEALEKTEEWWVTESRKNPLAFGEYVWGLKPAPHHVRWVKDFFDDDEKKRNVIVIAPRGSAKTTWLLICMLWYMSHHPHTANMILSVTALQAQARLQFMRDAIENNERYNRVFPNIKTDSKRSLNKSQLSLRDTNYRYSKWRSVVAKFGDGKSPTIYAAGVGGSGVIGSRVNGILALDDLLDEKSARTEKLRDTVWNWFTTTVLPILTGKKYRIWHVTTRWAETDIAQRQIDSGEYYYTYTRAIERGPTGELRSYWPSMFSLKDLLRILKVSGRTVFDLMFMNRVTGLAGEVFSADMLRNPLPDELPLFDEIVVSNDLAVGTDESNDESVISTMGIAHNEWGYPELYVLDMVAGKWKPGSVAKQIEKAYRKAARRFQTLPVLLIETVAAQKVYISLLEERGNIPMDMVRTYSPTTDKALRARPAAAMGEDDRLFFDIPKRERYKDEEAYLSHWYHATFSQMVEFTGERGNPDDRVDVITQVVQLYCGDVKAVLSTKADVVVVDMSDPAAALKALKEKKGQLPEEMQEPNFGLL